MQMTRRKRSIAERNGVLEKIYAQKVNKLIRNRYSTADEFAILRQRSEKPEEWAAYNAYCEECKKKAKEKMEAV